MKHKYSIKRRGRQWDVYRDDILLEGGFFSYDAACNCRDEYLLQDQLEEGGQQGPVDFQK